MRDLTVSRDWRSRRLGDLARIIGGGTPSRSVPAFWGGGIPWFTPGELSCNNAKIVNSSRETITDAGLSHSSARLLPPGALLMTTRATLGLVAITGVPAATNQGFQSLVCGPEIDTDFAYHLINWSKSSLERYATGSTFLEISRSKVADIELFLPPLPTQHRIAAILDMVDDAIRQTEAVIAKLKKIKAGMLHDLLTRGILSAEEAETLPVDLGAKSGELRPPPELAPQLYKKSELGRIPKGWFVAKFETLAAIIDPQPDHRAPPEVTGGEPYIGVGDFLPTGDVDFVSCRHVSTQALRKQQARFTVERGDILFGKIGTIGVPRLLPVGERPYALNANTVIIKPYHKCTYAYWLLNSPLVVKQIETDINSTSQPAFGIQKIRALTAVIPAVTEEESIANRLDSAEKRIAQEEALESKLKRLKSGLMDDLLTGKVRMDELPGDIEELLGLAARKGSGDRQ